MFPAASLLTVLLLAFSIVASTVEVRTTLPASLSFSKHIDTSNGLINLVQHDQACVAALLEGIQSGKSNTGPGPGDIFVGKNTASYIAEVGVGEPATTYNLILQLSSSNTWIGADKPYTPTRASRDTRQSVELSYGHAFFSGEEWLDTVSLSPELVVTDQSIGIASESHGFGDGIDGVLGLGPASLTLGTLLNQPNVIFPSVSDNLYNQATIPEEVVSIYLTLPTSNNEVKGELTFGGTDPSKYTGEITYTPITTTPPASGFWGINQTVTYGNTTLLEWAAGMINTDNTMILFSSDAYNAYKKSTGATEDTITKMLKLTPSQYDNLENLSFLINGVTFALTPNGQIWPRSLNSYIGGSSDGIYSVIGNNNITSGSGLDFVLGQPFLERFYSVFDTSRQRVGFASTDYTNAIVN